MLRSDPSTGAAEGLAGQRALVTGASGGIGRAVALALAQAGADVVLTARSASRLEEAAAIVRRCGRTAFVLPADLTDAGDVARLTTQTTRALGGIDILVNAAGVAGTHKIDDHPDDLWHSILAINLTSVYFTCKAVIPGMRERGLGRIVNIASIAGKIGGKYIAAYAASKHGVLGLTRSLALELAVSGITVNAICPGYVDTAMTARSVAAIVAHTGRTADQARSALEHTTPQQRLIDPAEIARVAVFLARRSSGGINGQAINVDGGAVVW